MPRIKVQITRFVDVSQPGFVECQFVDAHNRIWSFVEKLPIVTSDSDIWSDSTFPRPGMIDCEVVKRFKDAAGDVVAVTTEKPVWVESIEGETQFEIRPELLIEC